MISGNILIFSQDPGGCKFLLPVIKEYLKRTDISMTRVMVHPLSEPYFIENNIAFIPLESQFSKFNISQSDWEEYLKTNNIQRIFCTTSSPYLDQSNCNLVVAARTLRIPTLGIMDHWKGLDRFGPDETLEFLPDYLCCIDKHIKEQLTAKTGRPDQIFEVGHPYLEQLWLKGKATHRKSKVVNILLVSQPNSKDRSFESCFSIPVNGHPVILDTVYEISHAMKVLERPFQIAFRPHPKERVFDNLPDGVTLQPAISWVDALRENDIFIGLDSMALLEAFLQGKHCISLAIDELQEISDSSIPFEFSWKVKGIKELSKAISFIFNENKQQKESFSFLKDSTQRTLSVVGEFVKNADEA